MNNLSNRYFLFFTCVVTVAFFSGCSSNTNPSTGTLGPKAGSYFTTQYKSLDSNGVLVSSYTLSDTIAQSGLSIMGKTNVVAVRSGVPDLAYWNYEVNGDFSVLSDDAGYSAWYSYPFGSQGTIQLPVETPGNGIRITKTATGAGADSVVINGESFYTKKITITTAFSDTDAFSNQVLTQITVDTVRFAPALGWIVSEHTLGTYNPILNYTSNTQVNTLVDYKLY